MSALEFDGGDTTGVYGTRARILPVVVPVISTQTYDDRNTYYNEYCDDDFLHGREGTKLLSTVQIIKRKSIVFVHSIFQIISKRNPVILSVSVGILRIAFFCLYFLSVQDCLLNWFERQVIQTNDAASDIYRAT